MHMFTSSSDTVIALHENGIKMESFILFVNL